MFRNKTRIIAKREKKADENEAKTVEYIKKKKKEV